MAKLTEKQKRFAAEYAKLGNATQAALNAGYAKKAAYQTGAENLKKPQIAAYIDKLLKPVEKRRLIDAEDALDELIDIWQGKTQTSHSKHVDHLLGDEVIKHMTYESTPDLESKIKALDLYLKYKSLLSQAQLEKAQVEIKLLKAKLDTLERLDEQTTESKLDELLNRIDGELDDVE